MPIKPGTPVVIHPDPSSGRTAPLKAYPLQVLVVRVSETPVSRRVAAAFLNVGKEIQSLLGQKILLMERKELSGYG